MTPNDFKNWRKRNGFKSRDAAAKALGISAATVINYEAGHRREDPNRLVEIPKVVELACAEIEARITGTRKNQTAMTIYGGYVETLHQRFLAEFDRIETGFNFDFGPEFEIALCRALKNLLPSKYGVVRGYAVAQNGDSAGDDILVYEHANYPLVSARDTDGLSKEKVPIDAIYSYIEAKHTIFLSGQGDQSLSKAQEQVNNVKRLISKREERSLNNILPDINFTGNAQVNAPSGFPKIQNPAHGIIIARNVKENSSGPNLTDDEIYSFLQDKNATSHLKPLMFPADMMILGQGIVVLPINAASKYEAPFASINHANFWVARCPQRAFGVGLAALLEAIEWIGLAPMPWREIAISGIDIVDSRSN